jgi:hypothetical protein
MRKWIVTVIAAIAVALLYAGPALAGTPAGSAQTSVNAAVSGVIGFQTLP